MEEGPGRGRGRGRGRARRGGACGGNGAARPEEEEENGRRPGADVSQPLLPVSVPNAHFTLSLSLSLCCLVCAGMLDSEC